jgi:hypothetical protein
LLWKGPECCGDLHGIVIGCAVVEGGTIPSIDPFGGRRHVVHYPLLEHWGAQFGIAPLDVIASRFFSKLCCVGALPSVSPARPNVPSVVTRIGRGYIAVGDPTAIARELRERQISIVTQRRIHIPEMIASALTMIGSRRGEQQDQQPQYAQLVLADFVADQTVMLLVPEPA